MNARAMAYDLRAYADWCIAHYEDVPPTIVNDLNAAANMIEQRDVELAAMRTAAQSLKMALDELKREQTMEDQKLIEILYRDGYHAAAKRMEELLAKGEDAPSKWIPCNEKLPDEKQRVIFWVECNRAAYTGFYFYRGKRGAPQFRSARGCYTARCWMPLPEPPEVEK